MKKMWFWIIGAVVLLVIIVLVMLAPFLALGGFSTPNTCSTHEPYTCLDFEVSGNTAQFSISGLDIDKTPAVLPSQINNKVVGITLNGQPCGALVNDDLTLSGDNAQTVRCTLNSALKKGQKFDGTINLQYLKKGESGTHLVAGEFSGTAQ